MAHTRKDGRRGGGHRNTQGREVWSKRCRKVEMWDIRDTAYKRITHKHERREARRVVQASVSAMVADAVDAKYELPPDETEGFMEWLDWELSRYEAAV